MPEPRDNLGSSDAPLRQLALLVDSVTDYAIFLLDTDGNVLTWNPGAERTKGYSPSEIIGEHYSVFFPEEDRAAGRPDEALAAAAREGRHAENGWRVRKDGTRFWASTLLVALRNEAGNLTGYGKVTRDLTELRLAQEELDMFASSAAHDLREPLRTIAGFSQLLARRHADALPPDAREFLGHIIGASARMSRLIDDLLLYARSGAQQPEPEPVALSQVVETVTGQLTAALSERGLAVDARVPADATVLAQRAGTELVVQNLLSNAVRFADAAAPLVGVAAAREAGDWVVSVSDNGPGVPHADRERIFEPFTQLRRDDAGGTGLGLSIARRMVERHGGRIGVDGEPGANRFWFSLPAA